MTRQSTGKDVRLLCVSVCVSVSLSVCVSICLCLSVCLSVFICLFVCLSLNSVSIRQSLTKPRCRHWPYICCGVTTDPIDLFVCVCVLVCVCVCVCVCLSLFARLRSFLVPLPDFHPHRIKHLIPFYKKSFKIKFSKLFKIRSGSLKACSHTAIAKAMSLKMGS